MSGLFVHVFGAGVGFNAGVLLSNNRLWKRNISVKN